MALVKMTNLTGREIRVPGGAVKQYQNLGFSIVNEVENATDAGENTENTDDEFVASVTEKPIAQWSKEELKKYADIKGVDLTGMKTVNDVRAKVKEYLETNE